MKVGDLVRYVGDDKNWTNRVYIVRELRPPYSHPVVIVSSGEHSYSKLRFLEVELQTLNLLERMRWEGEGLLP